MSRVAVVSVLLLTAPLAAGCSVESAADIASSVGNAVADASVRASATAAHAALSRDLVDGSLPVAAVESLRTSFDAVADFSYADADADGFVDGTRVGISVAGSQFCLDVTPGATDPVRTGACSG